MPFPSDIQNGDRYFNNPDSIISNDEKFHALKYQKTTEIIWNAEKNQTPPPERKIEKKELLSFII